MRGFCQRVYQLLSFADGWRLKKETITDNTNNSVHQLSNKFLLRFVLHVCRHYLFVTANCLLLSLPTDSVCWSRAERVRVGSESTSKFTNDRIISIRLSRSIAWTARRPTNWWAVRNATSFIPQRLPYIYTCYHLFRKRSCMNVHRIALHWRRQQ